ncbi:MAG: SAM-dependent methyltransferase [Bacteroidetes bacterium]|nr:SAM-dependent methyltransferase [Bacteroidota bacterium]
MLLDAQNRIAELIALDSHSRFILTLSEPENSDIPTEVETMLSVPDKPQKITLKTILLRSEYRLQLSVYTPKQHFTQVLPAEMTIQAALTLVLNEPFRQAHLQTPNNDLYCRNSGKEKMTSIRKKPPSKKQWEQLQHDEQKNYIITSQNSSELLQDLGITAENGMILPTMQAKYKQINNFLSIASSLDILKNPPQNSPLFIVDCGCGKAYLSFALYHWLVNLRGMNVRLRGIDNNKQVIAFCQKTVKKLRYVNAEFECIDINTAAVSDSPVNLLIALHACDTATDDALAFAITHNAAAILAAPCCHHYLNEKMKQVVLPPSVGLLLQDGITRERFADLLTDSMRRDILASKGYSAHLMEFISPEHTLKNIMIKAEKNAVIPVAEYQKVFEAEVSVWKIAPKLAELIDI